MQTWTCEKIVNPRTVPCHDGVDLQNDGLVLLLHHLEFAELHRDDAICPMTESILQYVL
jgi:hypothetical protein